MGLGVEGGGNEEKSGTKYCSCGSTRMHRDPEVGILAHYTLVMMFIVHSALYER